MVQDVQCSQFLILDLVYRLKDAKRFRWIMMSDFWERLVLIPLNGAGT